jgi:hypothetical protein
VHSSIFVDEQTWVVSARRSGGLFGERPANPCGLGLGALFHGLTGFWVWG